MTKIEGPLWWFRFRALVLLCTQARSYFERIVHYTLYIYHGPCYRVRLHKLCDRGLGQLRGIVSRMLSEGPTAACNSIARF